VNVVESPSDAVLEIVYLLSNHADRAILYNSTIFILILYDMFCKLYSMCCFYVQEHNYRHWLPAYPSSSDI